MESRRPPADLQPHVDPKDPDGDLDSAIVQIGLSGGPAEVVSERPWPKHFRHTRRMDGRSPLSNGSRIRRATATVTGRSSWSIWPRPPAAISPIPRNSTAIPSRANRDGSISQRCSNSRRAKRFYRVFEKVAAPSSGSAPWTERAKRAIPAADERTVWFNRMEGGRGIIFRLNFGINGGIEQSGP